MKKTGMASAATVILLHGSRIEVLASSSDQTPEDPFANSPYYGAGFIGYDPRVTGGPVPASGQPNGRPTAGRQTIEGQTPLVPPKLRVRWNSPRPASGSSKIRLKIWWRKEPGGFKGMPDIDVEYDIEAPENGGGYRKNFDEKFDIPADATHLEIQIEGSGGAVDPAPGNTGGFPNNRLPIHNT